MKNKIKLLLLLPLLSISVISCATNQNQGSSNANDSSQTDINGPYDIQTAIKKLQAVDNFIIKAVGEGMNGYQAIYHPNYIYNSQSNFGYLTKNDVIYPFTFQNNKLVNKEKIENASLYGKQGVVQNFDNIDASLIKSGINELTTMKKAIALPLLDICGFDSSIYTKLDKIDIKIVDNDINKMTFDFYIKGLSTDGIAKEGYSFTLENVGDAHNLTIENFINEGQLSSIPEELLAIKELFNSNNFTRFEYDNQDDKLIMAELFHPSYYLRLYSDEVLKAEPIRAAEQVANLEIFKPEKTLNLLTDQEGNAIPLIYDDTYIFFYDGSYQTPGNLSIITRDNPKRPGYAQGAFTEVIKSVEDAWAYPSRLALFDNLDEFVHVKDGNSFNTLSKPLIDNFLKNFNLADAFQQYGGINELAITHDVTANEVTFTLFAKQGGYYQIYFGDFGKTCFTPFDDLLKSIESM